MLDPRDENLVQSSLFLSFISKVTRGGLAFRLIGIRKQASVSQLSFIQSSQHLLHFVGASMISIFMRLSAPEQHGARPNVDRATN